MNATMVARNRKPGKVTVLCGCGCGEEPRRGQFMPGHDARHLWRLVDQAIEGSAEARAELAERGWTKFLVLKESE